MCCKITLKTLHEMLDGMSVELAEKVHLLFIANYIDYSCGTGGRVPVSRRIGAIINQ